MKFRQVDEIGHNVCTIKLWEWEGQKRGQISYPIETVEGELISTIVPPRGDLRAGKAVQTAVWLLELAATPIDVYDPDGVWEAEWGELHR
jgi:hypothetical protein